MQAATQPGGGICVVSGYTARPSSGWSTNVNTNARVTKVGLGVAGLVTGVILAGTVGASAATSTPAPSAPSSSSSSTSTAADPHPGDNGADGVAESQEHHGPGGRHALGLSGTVTAVGTGTVTIKTSAGTTEYAVTSASDIDKNGEAALKDLAVGDAVTFSVDSANTKQIDKLHAGDETKNRPTAPAGSATTGTTSSGA